MAEEAREELVEELEEAYHDEVTSAFNYLSNGIRLEGFFGEMLGEDLAGDFQQELGHAEELARALDVKFDVVVPDASELDLGRQPFLHHDRDYDASDEAVLNVIEASIEAESGAIERYSRIIELADEAGYPDVRDMAEKFLSDEREHLDDMESLAEQFR